MSELLENTEFFIVLGIVTPVLAVVAYVRFQLWRMEREKEREELEQEQRQTHGARA